MATIENSVLESINHLLVHHPQLAPSVEAMAARVQGRQNHISVGATNPQALQQFFNAIKPVASNVGLVRIGGEGDGGYLVPDDFAGLAACFSPGVAVTADFELAMAARGIESYMVDYSIEKSPVDHPMLHFEKKYLGTTNNEVYVTLDDWVRAKAAPAQDLILQMDIEGAEYGVILDADRATLARFRMIVVEFHGMENLIHNKGFELVDLTFKKLLKDFEVVHIHPNNYARPVDFAGFQIPTTIEFSFHRRDRFTRLGYATQFPHPPDRANVPENVDFALPACWHA